MPAPMQDYRVLGAILGGAVFSAALVPGRGVDLEERRARELRRDDVDDGAPPYGRIDLDGGIVYL